MPMQSCCSVDRYTVWLGVVVAQVVLLAVPVLANEIRPGTIRSDASDCLYEQLASFLTVRVQLSLCPWLSRPKAIAIVSQQQHGWCVECLVLGTAQSTKKIEH